MNWITDGDVPGGAPVTSDQTWLTISSTTGGVIAFSFTANSAAAARTANISVLGLQIPVTQAPGLVASTTSVSSTLNPSTYGQLVTFTATVSSSSSTGKPTGTVRFMDGTTALSTGTLSNGAAAFSTYALGAGTHSISGVYSGDTNNLGSTSH